MWTGFSFHQNGYKSDLNFDTAQSAGAIEYTDCISTEGYNPHPHNESPGYDIKQSDGDTPVLVLSGMWSIPSLPLLQDLFCPGVVTPDRVVFMGQVELFDIQTVCKQIIYAELNCLK